MPATTRTMSDKNNTMVTIWLELRKRGIEVEIPPEVVPKLSTADLLALQNAGIPGTTSAKRGSGTRASVLGAMHARGHKVRKTPPPMRIGTARAAIHEALARGKELSPEEIINHIHKQQRLDFTAGSIRTEINRMWRDYGELEGTFGGPYKLRG
jgi:hypothetical protein